MKVNRRENTQMFGKTAGLLTTLLGKRPLDFYPIKAKRRESGEDSLINDHVFKAKNPDIRVLWRQNVKNLSLSTRV